MSDLKSSDANAPETKSPSDLSMAEILATMRRIIAEDELPPPPPAPSGDQESPAAPRATGGGVLELTEALNADGTVRHLAPIGGTAPRGEDDRAEPVFEQESAASPVTAASDEPPPLVEPARANAEPEPIISEETSLAAAASLAQIATIPQDRNARPGPRVGERPLEDLVAELLQPLLRTWLDENLPQVVERLVQREIDRVASRSRAG